MVHDAFGRGGADSPSVDVYDGDTPQVLRGEVRGRAQLLITNPDMLHQSVLPFHAGFGRLLANLAYVVVDEVRGVRGDGGGVVGVERWRAMSGGY